jgi:hypothetical protein
MQAGRPASQAAPAHRVQLWAFALVIALAETSAATAQTATRDAARDQIAERLRALRENVRVQRGGVIGLMGYSVVPDGSANALQVNRTSTSTSQPGDTTLTLSQFGFGFTVSEVFPLFLETYVGYARYDPRTVFTGDDTGGRVARWNNFAATIGVGYDIRLAENLWLRPIVNLSAGYAASDVSLLASFIQARTDVDISLLTDSRVNVLGHGGSLVLAYYDYRSERDIDVELRYTRIELETFGDTVAAARGTATAEALGAWGRYRWPTGREAFGRPIRWVLDGTATLYTGDQREAIGFGWSAKVGGGIEFDVGRSEVGAAGISLSRIRLIGRYFVGEGNITGTSFGIGMSF